MPRRANLLGQRFGKLQVTQCAGPVRLRKGSIRIMWVCLCDCGKEKLIGTEYLRLGTSRSCGCQRGMRVAPAVDPTHRRSAERLAWTNMKRRCTNQKSPRFKDWGGRGITVCDRWAKSFEAFLLDVGPRPSAMHSIDRIENDKNYEPGNVRWATKSQQIANRRPIRKIPAGSGRA
jgi:hypothetical protein